MKDTEIDMEKEMCEVPIWQKLTLTPEEASEYSNIGLSTIRRLLADPGCEFLLYVGRKKLIKRKQFEKYVEEVYAIDRN